MDLFNVNMSYFDAAKYNFFDVRQIFSHSRKFKCQHQFVLVLVTLNDALKFHRTHAYILNTTGSPQAGKE